MKINDAAKLLTAKICPSGISIRPDWFVTVGVGSEMVVYVSNLRQAKKIINQFVKDGEFEGHKVKIVKSGHFKMAGK